jgi:formate dehydrogenase major subunit
MDHAGKGGSRREADSVDPRFTQTASKADLYAPIRSGADIAFRGGMIKYIIVNDLYFRDYVVALTIDHYS